MSDINVGILGFDFVKTFYFWLSGIRTLALTTTTLFFQVETQRKVKEAAAAAAVAAASSAEQADHRQQQVKPRLHVQFIFALFTLWHIFNGTSNSLF